MAKGYLKIAHALRPAFANKLSSLFPPIEGSNKQRVIIAPIKDLRRCQAKLAEAAKNKENKPPYASTICDYLRATILCETMEEAMESLHILRDNSQIVRVKPRVQLADIGNKCILVNFVVEDPKVLPVKYDWSDFWWKTDETNTVIEKKTVKMIAEVQNNHPLLHHHDQ